MREDGKPRGGGHTARALQAGGDRQHGGEAGEGQRGRLRALPQARLPRREARQGVGGAFAPHEQRGHRQQDHAGGKYAREGVYRDGRPPRDGLLFARHGGRSAISGAWRYDQEVPHGARWEEGVSDSPNPGDKPPDQKDVRVFRLPREEARKGSDHEHRARRP